MKNIFFNVILTFGDLWYSIRLTANLREQIDSEILGYHMAILPILQS